MKFTKHMNLLRLPVLFLSILVLFQFPLNAQKVSIKGTISGIEEGELMLYEFYGSQRNLKESFEIKKGKFEITYKEGLDRGFYTLALSDEDALVIILGEEEIKIEAEKGNLKKAKVESSKEYDAFKEYQGVLAKANRGFNKVSKAISQARQEQNVNPESYNQKIDSLRKVYESVIKEQHLSYATLAKKYDGLFVGKICDYFRMKEGESADDYINVMALEDEELLRGDMFKTKLYNYYQQLIGANNQKLKETSLQLIKADLRPEAKEVVYSGIVELFAQGDQKFAARISKKYVEEFPNSIQANAYYDAFPKGPPQIGDVAPDIKLKDPEGNELSLSSMKGKIVLLDFWASWCGPCRRENPNVVKTYHEYKDQGFTVFSVSLDNNREKWLNAISKDGLVWENHVSDLKGWKSAGAAKYGVRSIPSTFLIDEKGEIVAVNLRGPNLERKLKEILSAN